MLPICRGVVVCLTSFLYDSAPWQCRLDLAYLRSLLPVLIACVRLCLYRNRTPIYNATCNPRASVHAKMLL